MTLTAEQISLAALALVDLPYQHQGRDEALGLDCAGVLVAAFRRLGVELKEEKINYRRLPAETHIRRCLQMNFEPVARDTSEPGDIVHIKFNRDSQARHLGIIVPGSRELQLVHALRERNQVLLELLRGALTRARIVGIYQWPR